jgi:hypothetical protein
MTPESSLALLNLRIVGALLAMLAFVNLFVPARFHWREEMDRLSLLNRQIFQAHNVFVILTIALCSALLLTAAETLLEPNRLSRAVLVGLTIFWGVRMVMQWTFYSARNWRGHRFNTAMHCMFSVAWVYMTATFATALWINISLVK